MAPCVLAMSCLPSTAQQSDRWKRPHVPWRRLKEPSWSCPFSVGHEGRRRSLRHRVRPNMASAASTRIPSRSGALAL
eukprot:420552-Prymnesium_polylepis.1